MPCQRLSPHARAEREAINPGAQAVVGMRAGLRAQGKQTEQSAALAAFHPKPPHAELRMNASGTRWGRHFVSQFRGKLDTLCQNKRLFTVNTTVFGLFASLSAAEVFEMNIM